MRKYFLMLVVLIGFGVSVSAQNSSVLANSIWDVTIAEDGESLSMQLKFKENYECVLITEFNGETIVSGTNNNNSFTYKMNSTNDGGVIECSEKINKNFWFYLQDNTNMILIDFDGDIITAKKIK